MLQPHIARACAAATQVPPSANIHVRIGQRESMVKLLAATNFAVLASVEQSPPPDEYESASSVSRKMESARVIGVTWPNGQRAFLSLTKRVVETPIYYSAAAPVSTRVHEGCTLYAINDKKKPRTRMRLPTRGLLIILTCARARSCASPDGCVRHAAVVHAEACYAFETFHSSSYSLQQLRFHERTNAGLHTLERAARKGCERYVRETTLVPLLVAGAQAAAGLLDLTDGTDEQKAALIEKMKVSEAHVHVPSPARAARAFSSALPTRALRACA